MELNFLKKRKAATEETISELSVANSSTSNSDMLVRAGLQFDYFVDDAEGPTFDFDEEVVKRRAESARARLLGKLSLR